MKKGTINKIKAFVSRKTSAHAILIVALSIVLYFYDNVIGQIEQVQQNKRNHSILFETLLEEANKTTLCINDLFSSKETHDLLINRKLTNKHLNKTDSLLFILQHGGVYKQNFKEQTFSFTRMVEITPLSPQISSTLPTLLSLNMKLRKLCSSYTNKETDSAQTVLLKQKEQTIEQFFFSSEQAIQSSFAVIDNQLTHKTNLRDKLYKIIYTILTFWALIVLLFYFKKKKTVNNTKTPALKTNISSILNSLPISALAHSNEQSITITNTVFQSTFNDYIKNKPEGKESKKNILDFIETDNEITHNGQSYSSETHKLTVNGINFTVKYLLPQKLVDKTRHTEQINYEVLHNIIYKIATSLPLFDNDSFEQLLSIIDNNTNADISAVFKIESSSKGKKAFSICTKNSDNNNFLLFRKLPNKSNVNKELWERMENEECVTLHKSSSKTLQALEIQNAVIFPLHASNSLWGGIVLEYSKKESIPTEAEKSLITKISSCLSKAILIATTPAKTTSLLDPDQTHRTFLQKESQQVHLRQNELNKKIAIYKGIINLLSEEFAEVSAKIKLISPDLANIGTNNQLLKELHILNHNTLSFNTNTTIRDCITNTVKKLKKALPNVMVEMQVQSSQTASIPIEQTLFDYILLGMAKAIYDNHKSHLIIISLTLKDNILSIIFDEKHSNEQHEILKKEFEKINMKEELEQSTGITLLCINELVKEHKGKISGILKNYHNFKYIIDLPIESNNLKQKNSYAVLISDNSSTSLNYELVDTAHIQIFDKWKEALTEISVDQPNLLIIDKQSNKAANTKLAQYISNSRNSFSIAISKDNILSDVCDLSITPEELIVYTHSILSLASEKKNPNSESRLLIIDNDTEITKDIKQAFSKTFTIIQSHEYNDTCFKLDKLKPSLILISKDIFKDNFLNMLLSINIHSKIYVYGKKKMAKEKISHSVQLLELPVDWEMFAEHIQI